VFEKYLKIDEVFLLMLKEHTAGDPMDEKLKWTNLTGAEMVNLLSGKGFEGKIYTTETIEVFLS
jgi:hypothetical protein